MMLLALLHHCERAVIQRKRTDVWKVLDRVSVCDSKALENMSGTLSVMPNSVGGIIDDTMITRVDRPGDDHIYQVINAGCADKDIAHLKEQYFTTFTCATDMGRHCSESQHSF